MFVNNKVFVISSFLACFIKAKSLKCVFKQVYTVWPDVYGMIRNIQKKNSIRNCWESISWPFLVLLFYCLHTVKMLLTWKPLFECDWVCPLNICQEVRNRKIWWNPNGFRFSYNIEYVDVLGNIFYKAMFINSSTIISKVPFCTLCSSSSDYYVFLHKI